ncbi:hypothetical protein ABZS93_25880 [Streptomyces sp900116325]|uniref:hypothetical protein n=1 Tax=Streptomyces sp. 900116325 TaxID=3154295 RepID=UPI0033BF3D05
MTSTTASTIVDHVLLSRATMSRTARISSGDPGLRIRRHFQFRVLPGTGRMDSGLDAKARTDPRRLLIDRHGRSVHYLSTEALGSAG